ncbi:hypothetical protein XENOCAPTIV_017566, partial [Xenoophorus captivus]
EALDNLMLEGDNIVSAARRAIMRHDYSAVLTIFPILRHLKMNKSEFDSTLQVGALGLIAILFLQQLLDFHETAGAMLASQGTVTMTTQTTNSGHGDSQESGEFVQRADKAADRFLSAQVNPSLTFQTQKSFHSVCFSCRCANISFTKNPEKYHKYRPEEVEEMIEKLFDTSA